MPRLKLAAHNSELFRKLPSVDELLRAPELAALAEREGRAAVTDAARTVLDNLRREITTGALDAAASELALGGMAQAVERQLRAELSYSLR